MDCTCLKGLRKLADAVGFGNSFMPPPPPMPFEGLTSAQQRVHQPERLVPPNLCCTAIGAGAPSGLCRFGLQGDLLVLGSKDTGRVICARLLAGATITVHGHDINITGKSMAPLRLCVWCSAEAFRWARELHDASTLWTKREALRKSLRCSASRSTVRCSSSEQTLRSSDPQDSWPQTVEEEYPQEYCLDSASSLFSPSESEVDEDERWFENENKCDSEEEVLEVEVENFPSHTASAPSLRRPPLMPSGPSGPLASHARSAPSLPQVDDFRADMAEEQEEQEEHEEHEGEEDEEYEDDEDEEDEDVPEEKMREEKEEKMPEAKEEKLREEERVWEKLDDDDEEEEMPEDAAPEHAPIEEDEKHEEDEENEEAEDVPEEKMQQEDETMGAEKEEEMPEEAAPEHAPIEDAENEEAEDVPEEKMQQEDETMGAEKEEEMPEDAAPDHAPIEEQEDEEDEEDEEEEEEDVPEEKMQQKKEEKMGADKEQKMREEAAPEHAPIEEPEDEEDEEDEEEEEEDVPEEKMREEKEEKMREEKEEKMREDAAPEHAPIEDEEEEEVRDWAMPDEGDEEEEEEVREWQPPGKFNEEHQIAEEQKGRVAEELEAAATARVKWQRQDSTSTLPMPENQQEQWPSLKHCEVTGKKVGEHLAFTDPDLHKKLKLRRAISEGLTLEEAEQQLAFEESQLEDFDLQRKLTMRREISEGSQHATQEAEPIPEEHQIPEAPVNNGDSDEGSPGEEFQASDLEDFVEERMRRSTELLQLFSQEQEWLDQAADIMAARRLQAKEEAAAIDALAEEDAEHQEELDELEAYVHQISEHCSGGSSEKPDLSQFQALEAKMKRNASMPSIATRARQSLSKSGSMPLGLVGSPGEHRAAGSSTKIQTTGKPRPTVASAKGLVRGGVKAATDSAASTPSRRPSLPGQPDSPAASPASGAKASAGSTPSTPSRRRPSLTGQPASPAASPASGAKASAGTTPSTTSRRRPSLTGQPASPAASPASDASERTDIPRITSASRLLQRQSSQSSQS